MFWINSKKLLSKVYLSSGDFVFSIYFINKFFYVFVFLIEDNWIFSLFFFLFIVINIC